MKIAMILDKEFPPDPRVNNEARCLIETGHDVTVFCLDYSGKALQQETYHGIKIYRKRLKPWTEKLGILNHTIPIFSSLIEDALLKFISAKPYDVIHVHDMQIAGLVFEVNKIFQLPVVLDLHENRPEIMKHYSHVKSFPGNMLVSPAKWKRREKKFIEEATNVIVVTEEARDYYVKNFQVNPKKFYVVPNTVDRSFYLDPPLDDKIINRYKDRFVILYLGNTGLRRGLLTAIQAVKNLTSEIPELLLLIVGKSNTDHILQNMVSELHVDNYVELAGWQDVADFPSYVVAADIGISPLHKNIHHDTTYANKVFQYLSMGKPIIVSNCLTQERIVNDFQCGLVFKDRNPLDLSAKIRDLYQDPDKMKELSGNARKAITESLTWEIVSGELIELYKTFE